MWSICEFVKNRMEIYEGFPVIFLVSLIEIAKEISYSVFHNF